MDRINLLVNGASVSRGPNSWPYFLSEQMDANLVNLSQAGAGSQYILYTTLAEVYSREYNLVLVMWPEPHRYDLQVEDISYFSKSTYTSEHQSYMNDWPEKVIHPINDQDLVQKDWIFGIGHINNDKTLRQTKAFDAIYRYVGSKQFANRLVSNVLLLQNTLQHLNIPYIFTFDNDYNDLLSETDLYSKMDFDRIISDDYLFSIANRLNDYEQDNLHPGMQTHKEWASIVEKYITANNIL